MVVELRARPFADTYLLLLSSVLLGYALLGKGFAYLGFPPIYVGEIALLTGVIVFLRTGCFFGVLTTPPALFLAAIMGWVLLRTLPFIGQYGVDALRDSAVVMYGGFAYIIAALLLEDSRRIEKLVQFYRKFLKIYIPLIPFIFLMCRYIGQFLPNMPGTDVALVQVQPTDLAPHLTGAAVFALVGLGKLTWLRAVLLIAGLVMAGTVSRGALLAEVVPIIAALVMLGKWRQLLLSVASGMLVFAAAYTVEPVFFEYVEAASSDERPMSTRQLAENALSIIGQGGEQVEGTKEWRIEWWKMIVDTTLFGPNFWTGRGFGLNIALADGFSNWRSSSGNPPLRSPHNVQMTILARAGVPGLLLWFGVVLSWLAMIFHAMQAARCDGHREWAGLFLCLASYISSMLINASFDPVLEGPMQGIWFWSLFGFGIGSVMVYRSRQIRVGALPTEIPTPI